jgi:hypothetical protein
MKLIAGSRRGILLPLLATLVFSFRGIDYKAYLRELSRLPVDAPLMLEHLKSCEEYDEGRHYIQGVARELGLSKAPEEL